MTFFHKRYHIFNNITNPFIKNNKDRHTSNNIHLIIFQAMHNYILVIIQSCSIMCFNNTIHSQMKAKMWLSSLQSLAFSRGLSAYKYKTSKIRKHKKKYESGDDYTTLKIKHIGHPKLGISACHSYCGITTG